MVVLCQTIYDPRIKMQHRGVWVRVTVEALKVWTQDYSSSPRDNRNLPVVFTGHSENTALTAG